MAMTMHQHARASTVHQLQVKRAGFRFTYQEFFEHQGSLGYFPDPLSRKQSLPFVAQAEQARGLQADDVYAAAHPGCERVDHARRFCARRIDSARGKMRSAA